MMKSARANGDRPDSGDESGEMVPDSNSPGMRETNTRARKQTAFFAAEQSGTMKFLDIRRSPPVPKDRPKTSRTETPAMDHDTNMSPECSDIDGSLSPPWNSFPAALSADIPSEVPLRESWELAAIYNFFSSFGVYVDVDADGLDLAELESDLCRPDASSSALLANLHLPLLKSAMKGLRIAKQPLSSENWAIGLAKYFSAPLLVTSLSRDPPISLPRPFPRHTPAWRRPPAGHSFLLSSQSVTSTLHRAAPPAPALPRIFPPDPTIPPSRHPVMDPPPAPPLPPPPPLSDRPDRLLVEGW
jgi:hypothetical protein